MISSEKEFYDFIDKNKDRNPDRLRLALRPQNFNFDLNLAIIQIECRKKNATKLNTFLKNRFFLFPDSISAEQSSHQAIARFHSLLIKDSDSVLDMTAGLGIDALYMANKASKIIAIELNEIKARTLSHNARFLNISNIEIKEGDSVEFLKINNSRYDVIFVDPSRRGDNNKRLYDLRDCSPDIIENQDLLLNHSDRILIKASPLLDLDKTIKDFKNISIVRAIGVKGECKELLIELQKLDSLDQIRVEAINLDNDGNIISRFVDNFNRNSSEPVTYAYEEDIQPGIYLMEPSAMVMKLSPWTSICERFNAKKLGKSTHLFITTQKPENFPGRVTIFDRVIKKQDRKMLSGNNVSVVSRNHPLSTEEIRRIFKLKEGDKTFIYASRIGEKPILLLSHQI